MDQKKIGSLLKELRKEKSITQEQLAEIVHVSGRTVSRWENGNNLPDLDILIELSDYYNVELREILDGERKSENMNKEEKEVVLKAVDYTKDSTDRFAKSVNLMLLIGVISLLASEIISRTSLDNIEFLSNTAEFCEGFALGILIVAVLCTCRFRNQILAFKRRIFKMDCK